MTVFSETKKPCNQYKQNSSHLLINADADAGLGQRQRRYISCSPRVFSLLRKTLRQIHI